MTASDEEAALIGAARTGDPEAVLALVDRYQAVVYRFGKRMCPTEEDAEDAVQETLVTAIQKLGDFRGDASFSSWLFTIVRSRCGRKQRAASRAPVLEPIELVDDRPRPDDLLNQAELRQALETALATIEPMYREVLLLRDVEGLTASEVAAALEITVPAVKSRLHRARSMLRDRVERMFPHRLPTPALPLAPGKDLGELLSQYLEGDLTAAQCVEIEARLKASPDCQGACSLLRRILGECRACGADKPPEALALSVRNAIRAMVSEGRANPSGGGTPPTQ
ncbi:MAG: sigma-70 family RNA polymerase sigma factor [Polyangiaceae bacterium]|nr:sigma-70 family RNA polymerase sigma factor [Polyangiaceae bacterium]